ncbi:hypothetical protein ATANTOWER_025307 [Ataeniobius toweri]|uniref:Uncharacterized protein n=1 Tax=Ataeniobius toweri TaxID=208326 RepID=A0ABU7B093_9TELE|nr:hypothetical protein [Ataeniobius toweri]
MPLEPSGDRAAEVSTFVRCPILFALVPFLHPAGGGPTGGWPRVLFWLVLAWPRQVTRGATQPPVALRRVPTPGLAPGRTWRHHVPRLCGPHEGVLNRSLSDPSPRACLPWETLPGAFKPQTT